MAATFRAACTLVAGLLVAGLATTAWTPSRAQREQADDALMIREADWPCHGRYRLSFSAGAFWQGPSLDNTPTELEAKAETRKLAERLAAPETSGPEAKALIGRFAARLPQGEDRGPPLALLFAGVLEEANLYRRFILEGIVGAVGRNRVAAEALAESEVELHTLAGDPSTEAGAARKALEERRFWQQRAFERAEGEARFLCRRLTALEGKLGSLARAIAGHL